MSNVLAFPVTRATRTEFEPTRLRFHLNVRQPACRATGQQTGGCSKNMKPSDAERDDVTRRLCGSNNAHNSRPMRQLGIDASVAPGPMVS